MNRGTQEYGGVFVPGGWIRKMVFRHILSILQWMESNNLSLFALCGAASTAAVWQRYFNLGDESYCDVIVGPRPARRPAQSD